MLRLIPAALLSLVLVGCAGGDAPESNPLLPVFPPEPTRADFPGLNYPDFRGELPAPGSLHGPVWLVGIDGATWDLIEPLVARGELPSFATLIDAGSYGVLLSEEPTIWELVGSAGGRSVVVGWLGSFPAEAISGVYASKGFDPENPRDRQVHPPTAAETLRQSAPVELRQSDVDAIARSEFLRKTLLEDARALAVFKSLVGANPPEFAALYLSGIDVVQHVTWHHAGPMQPVEAYDFQLEVLLEQLGLTRDDAGPVLAIGELYRHVKRIRLNLEGIEENGTVPVDEAAAQAETIRRRLEALRTDDGDAVFASVIDHTTDPDWVPGDPALTVRFSSEAMMTSRVRDGNREFDFSPVRMRHTDVSGAHRLEGIVLRHGPGVRPGRLSEPATLYQIAPTLLHFLGLPQDRRMLSLAPPREGVLVEALDAELLEINPVLMVAEYPHTDRRELIRSREPGAGDGEIDTALDDAMEKLRGLGYVR
jgi:predicted AlkP superfamily phosphohydrolase/phosphomutase